MSLPVKDKMKGPISRSVILKQRKIEELWKWEQNAGEGFEVIEPVTKRRKTKMVEGASVIYKMKDIVNAIKIFSININGYSELKVRGYVEEACKKLGGCPFIICLQETHLIKGSPGERNFIYLAKECKCVAYPSSGEKTKEGVAVLVSEKIEMWVDVKELINARMQEITISKNEEKVGIINLYAPNDEGKNKQEFFKVLKVKGKKAKIWIGDFNEVWDSEVDRSGNSQIQGGKALDIKNWSDGRIDVWRDDHPMEFEFTWLRINNDVPICSRLDYALVTKEFRGEVAICQILPKIQLSDHCMIEICISVEKMELTQYRSKKVDIPSSRPFKVGKIAEEKKQKYADWIEKRKPEETTLDKMIIESAKANIGEKKGREVEKEEDIMSDQRIKEIVKASRKLGKMIRKVIKRTKKMQVVSAENLIMKAKRMKREFRPYIELNMNKKELMRNLRKAERKIDRAAKERERFLVNKKMKEINKQKMELDFQSRETHKTGSVKKETHVSPAVMIQENGKVAGNDEEYKKVHEEYYKKLFEQCEWKPDEQFYALPRAEREEDNAILKLITKEELSAYLRSMKNGKAVPDGIQPELLKWLGDEGRNALCDKLNTCITRKDMCDQWKVGRLNEIYKGAGNPNDLNNYRPITLLPAEGKILGGILARRISISCERNKILDPMQVGFREGKQISELLTQIIRVYRERKEKGKPLHVLMVDLVKAYDRVPHKLITYNLEYYGFPRTVCEMIGNIYKNLRTVILTKKGLTNEIDIEKGVRQGDPLSCILFVLAINPLLEKLRTLNGFKVGEERITHGAMADDIITFSESMDEARIAIDLVHKFCDMGGMIVSMPKTKYVNSEGIVALKTSKGILEASDPNESIRYLGILINLNLDWYDHWEAQKGYALKQLEYLKRRRLTINQKINVINAQIWGKLRYAAVVVPLEEGTIKMLQQKAEECILKAGSFPNSVARALLKLRREDGGTGLIDLKTALAISYLTNMYQNVMINHNENESNFIGEEIKEGMKRGEISTDCKGYMNGTFKNQTATLLENLRRAAFALGMKIRTPIINEGLVVNSGLPKKVKDLCIERKQYYMNEISLEDIRNNLSMEEVGRTEEEINKYKFMSCKWWNRKNPIIQKVKEGKINLAKDQECWVFTDGSEKDGKVGYGWTIHGGIEGYGRARGEQMVLNGEIQAVRAALQKTPSDRPIRVFTDNKNVYNMLSDIILKLPIKWKKVKFATVYREIENLMKNKEVKIEWYPSHAEKKLSEGGKNAEEVKNGRTRWKEWAKIIEKGNGKADELAAKGRESQWQEEFPSHPDIQIWYNDKMVDGDIAEVIKKKENQRMKEELKSKKSAKPWASDKVDWNLSQLCFSKSGRYNNSLMRFAIKCRTNNLPTKARMYKILKYQPRTFVKMSGDYENEWCESCLKKGVQVKETAGHILIEEERCENRRKEIWEEVKKLFNEISAPLEIGKFIPCWFKENEYVEWKQELLEIQTNMNTFPKIWGAAGLCPRDLPKLIQKICDIPKKRAEKAAKEASYIVLQGFHKIFKKSRENMLKLQEERTNTIERKRKWNLRDETEYHSPQKKQRKVEAKEEIKERAVTDIKIAILGGNKRDERKDEHFNDMHKIVKEPEMKRRKVDEIKVVKEIKEMKRERDKIPDSELKEVEPPRKSQKWQKEEYEDKVCERLRRDGYMVLPRWREYTCAPDAVTAALCYATEGLNLSKVTMEPMWKELIEKIVKGEDDLSFLNRFRSGTLTITSGNNEWASKMSTVEDWVRVTQAGRFEIHERNKCDEHKECETTREGVFMDITKYLIAENVRGKLLIHHIGKWIQDGKKLIVADAPIINSYGKHRVKVIERKVEIRNRLVWVNLYYGDREYFGWPKKHKGKYITKIGGKKLELKSIILNRNGNHFQALIRRKDKWFLCDSMKELGPLQEVKYKNIQRDKANLPIMALFRMKAG